MENKIPPISTKITRKLANESSDHKSVLNYYSSISRDETGAPARWKMSSNASDGMVPGRASPALAKLARSRSNSRDSSSERKKINSETVQNKNMTSAKKNVMRKSMDNSKRSETEQVRKGSLQEGSSSAKSDLSTSRKLKNEKEQTSTDIEKVRKRGRPKSESFKNISLLRKPNTKQNMEKSLIVSTAQNLLKKKRGRPKSLDLPPLKSSTEQVNGDEESFRSPHPLTPCNILVKRKKGRPKETPPTLEPEPSMSPNAQEVNVEYSEGNIVATPELQKRGPGRPPGKKSIKKFNEQLNRVMLRRSKTINSSSGIGVTKSKINKKVLSNSDEVSMELDVASVKTEVKVKKTVLGTVKALQKRKMLPVSNGKKVQATSLTRKKKINASKLGKGHTVDNSTDEVNTNTQLNFPKDKPKSMEVSVAESNDRKSISASSLALFEVTVANVARGTFEETVIDSHVDVYDSDKHVDVCPSDKQSDLEEELISDKLSSRSEQQSGLKDKAIDKSDSGQKSALRKGARGRVKSKAKTLKDTNSALNVKKKRMLISHAKKHMDSDMAHLPVNDLRRKLHKNLMEKLQGKRGNTDITESELKGDDLPSVSEIHESPLLSENGTSPLENLSAMVKAKRFTKSEKEQSFPKNLEQVHTTKIVSETKELTKFSDNESTSSEISSFSSISNFSFTKQLGEKECEDNSSVVSSDQKLKNKRGRKRKISATEEFKNKQEKYVKTDLKEIEETNALFDKKTNDWSIKETTKSPELKSVNQTFSQIDDCKLDSGAGCAKETKTEVRDDIQVCKLLNKTNEGDSRLSQSVTEDDLAGKNGYDVQDSGESEITKTVTSEMGPKLSSNDLNECKMFKTIDKLETVSGHKETLHAGIDKKDSLEHGLSEPQWHEKGKAQTRKSKGAKHKPISLVTSKKYRTMNILKHVRKVQTTKKKQHKALNSIFSKNVQKSLIVDQSVPKLNRSTQKLECEMHAVSENLLMESVTTGVQESKRNAFAAINVSSKVDSQNIKSNLASEKIESSSKFIQEVQHFKKTDEADNEGKGDILTEQNTGLSSKESSLTGSTKGPQDIPNDSVAASLADNETTHIKSEISIFESKEKSTKCSESKLINNYNIKDENDAESEIIDICNSNLHKEHSKLINSSEEEGFHNSLTELKGSNDLVRPNVGFDEPSSINIVEEILNTMLDSVTKEVESTDMQNQESLNELSDTGSESHVEKQIVPDITKSSCKPEENNTSDIDISSEIIENSSQVSLARKPISNAEIMSRRKKRRRKREKKLVKDGAAGFSKIELRQKISRSPLDNIALRQSIEETEYMNEQAKKAIKRGRRRKFNNTPTVGKDQETGIELIMENPMNTKEGDNALYTLNAKEDKTNIKGQIKRQYQFHKSEPIDVFDFNYYKDTDINESEALTNEVLTNEFPSISPKAKEGFRKFKKYKGKKTLVNEEEITNIQDEKNDSELKTLSPNSTFSENSEYLAVPYKELSSVCRPCSVVLTDFLKQLQLQNSNENSPESQVSPQGFTENDIGKSDDIGGAEGKRASNLESVKQFLGSKTINESVHLDVEENRLESSKTAALDTNISSVGGLFSKTNDGKAQEDTLFQNQMKIVPKNAQKKPRIKREKKTDNEVKTARTSLSPKVPRKSKVLATSSPGSRTKKIPVSDNSSQAKTKLSNYSFEIVEQTARKTVPPLKIKLKGGLTSKTKLYTVESAIEIKPSSVDSALAIKPKRKYNKSKSKSDSESEKHKSRHHHTKRKSKSPESIDGKKNGKKTTETPKRDPLKPNDPYEANFLEFIQQQENAKNSKVNWISSVVSKANHQLVGGKACKSGDDGSLTVSACAVAETKTSSCTSENIVTMSKSSSLVQTSNKSETLYSNANVEAKDDILRPENSKMKSDLEHFQQTEKVVCNLASKVAIARQYCCNHCDFSCESQNEILEHTKCLHKDELLYSCSICHKLTFKTKLAILAHLSDKHKGVKDSYICLPDFHEKHSHPISSNNVSDNIFDKMTNLLDIHSTKDDAISSRAVVSVERKTAAEADSTTTTLDEQQVNISVSSSTEVLAELISPVKDKEPVEKELKSTEESIEETHPKVDDSLTTDNELNIKIIDVVSLKGQALPDSEERLDDSSKIVNNSSTSPKIVNNSSTSPEIVNNFSTSPKITPAPANVSSKESQLKVPSYPVSQTSACTTPTQNVKTSLVSSEKKTKVGTTYKCEACHVHAPVLAALVAHLKNSHTNIPKLFQCPYCRDMEGETEAMIHQHIRKFHPTDNPNPPVALSEPAKRNLKTITIPLPDKAESTTIERDIYMCLRCKKHLPSLELIYNHLELVHREVFVYVCPFCKIFKAKEESIVNTHVVTVHQRNIEDVSISLAIDGTEFLRVTSLMKDKGQKVTAKPITPRQQKPHTDINQIAKAPAPNLTIPFHQNMAPISQAIRPSQPSLQQSVFPQQVPNVRAPGPAPLQGAKKRKATLSESIAQLTMQRQRQQAQEDAIKMQSNNKANQTNLNSSQQPPPLLRGPPPLIRYDQLSKVPASLLAAQQLLQSGKPNNRVVGQQGVPNISSSVIGQLTISAAQRLQALNNPQSNANLVQSTPKPIQSSLFDTSDQNAFLPVNRRQQGPVLNIPQIPRPANRPPSQQSTQQSGQTVIATGGTPLDLSRSNKSTPEPSPAPQPSQSPVIDNKSDDTNPEAFKIFNLQPAAPIQQTQANVTPHLVRPNTTSTLAYRPTTPHVANVPLNAVVGNVNMVPISLSNISIQQIQNIPQFVRMSYPQALQPIVAPLSIAQVIPTPQPVISTASTPQSSAEPAQQSKDSQAMMNLSLPMFKCPYCPNVVQLNLAEVQPHIEKSHPGSSIVFMQI